MKSTSSGEKNTTKNQMQEAVQGPLGLNDLEVKFFRLDGQTFNVADAADEIFDAFIRQFVQVGWTLEDRRNALNAALNQPDEVEKPKLLDAEELEEPWLEACDCGGSHLAGTVDQCPLNTAKR